MDINMPAMCEVPISRRRCPREKQPDRRCGADFVKIHYSGFLEDGTQFEDTRDKDPLEFLVGSGRVVSGIDAVVEVLYVLLLLMFNFIILIQ
jgi:FKBP-type peptidyl-prolyl cis-trans isomerase